MKTMRAIYKGNRSIQLSKDIEIPKDSPVIVIIPEVAEKQMRNQLKLASETAFKKIWDNKNDDVWNDYL